MGEAESNQRAGGDAPGPGDPTSGAHRGGLWAAAVVALALAAGAGGYALGSSSGEDLAAARRDGARAGQQAGTASGTRQGTRDGLRAGRKLGFRPAYKKAYRAAYRRALRSR